MGDIQKAPRVTPLVAMLSSNPAHFEAARVQLEKLLGPVELVSPIFSFQPTMYYAQSMGTDLKRCFFAFERFADPGEMATWKIAANQLEAELKAALAPDGVPNRPVNIDPGYVTGSKLLLASTKDYPHRIYLRDGIYAEITITFRSGKWISHKMTFPDFESGIYDSFLTLVRDGHVRKSRALNRGESDGGD